MQSIHRSVDLQTCVMKCLSIPDALRLCRVDTVWKRVFSHNRCCRELFLVWFGSPSSHDSQMFGGPNVSWSTRLELHLACLRNWLQSTPTSIKHFDNYAAGYGCFYMNQFVGWWPSLNRTGSIDLTLNDETCKITTRQAFPAAPGYALSDPRLSVIRNWPSKTIEIYDYESRSVVRTLGKRVTAEQCYGGHCSDPIQDLVVIHYGQPCRILVWDTKTDQLRGPLSLTFDCLCMVIAAYDGKLFVADSNAPDSYESSTLYVYDLATFRELRKLTTDTIWSLRATRQYVSVVTRTGILLLTHSLQTLDEIHGDGSMIVIHTDVRLEHLLLRDVERNMLWMAAFDKWHQLQIAPNFWPIGMDTGRLAMMNSKNELMVCDFFKHEPRSSHVGSKRIRLT